MSFTKEAYHAAVFRWLQKRKVDVVSIRTVEDGCTVDPGYSCCSAPSVECEVEICYVDSKDQWRTYVYHRNFEDFLEELFDV